MTILKKISGNYVDVVNALGLSPGYYGVQKREAYDQQVAKDLPRICYVNFSGNVAGMKKRLADTSHLKDKELSYTQGDFYGGVFTESRIKATPIFIETTMSASEEGTLKNYFDTLAFAYDDDNGRHCGFSLGYLRDDSDLTIPVEQRPLNYALTIIRDVNKAPSEREVTFLTHPAFLPKKNGKAIDSQMVVAEMAKELHSESIQKLLTPLFNEQGAIDFPQFQALAERITPDHNLDDRDAKLNKLLDVYTLWVRLLADKSKTKERADLLKELNTQMIGAFTDVDFFKDKRIEDVEAFVAKYKNHPILATLPTLDKSIDDYAVRKGFASYEAMQKEMNQSFLERNKGPLIVLGVALLAVISIALTLTGVLAPIGILAGIGLALAVTAATAAATSVADTELDFSDSCYARSILSCHIFKLLPSNLVRSKNQFVLNSKVI
ncbi:hypothetical protein ELY15_15730 [Legionella sp. km772]|nr:hypothetical protein ELY15_15730 [Legionella sp. km772]